MVFKKTLFSTVIIGVITVSNSNAQSIPHTSISLSEDSIVRLRSDLCSILSLGSTHDQTLTSKLEDVFVEYTNLEKDTPNFKLKVAEMWNKYSDKMICNPSNSGVFPKQHLFQRAIIQGLHIPVLENFFFEDEDKFPIDPNIITKNQYGEDETILDYINSIITTPEIFEKYNKAQIIGLRDIIKDIYNGKKAKEL